ncbi:unnamed protein product [Phytophthora fragariaefolia]|uniref:Unnamed protein product n=1 Tax=Phytophthora fragariaefolia TaxID=1490495 RepID=A0A9W6Y7K0_9STRA|nr:unnamed protein product [Phytophthora fragariaefolia]
MQAAGKKPAKTRTPCPKKAAAKATHQLVTHSPHLSDGDVTAGTPEDAVSNAVAAFEATTPVATPPALPASSSRPPRHSNNKSRQASIALSRKRRCGILQEDDEEREEAGDSEDKADEQPQAPRVPPRCTVDGDANLMRGGRKLAPV